MSPASTPHDSDEERSHARSLALDPQTVTGAELVGLLGHHSWRVRKATLAHAERLRCRPDLFAAVIAALGEPENAGLRSACAEALISIGEVVVPDLIHALATPDVDRRKFVVEVLGAIGSPGVGQRLVAALDDDDENVRASVVAALAQLGDRDTVQALRRRLATGAADTQLAAYVLSALTELGAVVPFAELAVFLDRLDLARLTYPLLGRCQDARARRLLVEAVGGGPRGARREALRALATQCRQLDAASEVELRGLLVSSPDAMRAIEEALDSQDDAVAEAAVVVLGLVGDPARVPRLLEAAASRPFMRAAFEAIRPLGARVVPPLLAALDSTSTEARVLALEAIESFGDARAVPKLLTIAASNEPRASEAAVSALGKLGGPECIEPLMAVVRDSESDIVRQTALALAALGMRFPGEVASRIRSVLADGDVRPVWIVVLGLLGRSDDAATIVAASRHRDPDVRRAAVEALGAYHSDVDESVVVLLLTDESPGVRAAAARALGNYHGDDVVSALLVSIGDTDPLVVAEALRALGSAGGARAAATLLDAAAGSQAPVAIAALQSLFRLRPAGLEQAAQRALHHADPEVVREAIVLTMRLGIDEAVPLLLPCLCHRSWHVRLAAAEMLANREVAVAEEVVLPALESEQEPLVREALQRLVPAHRGGH